MSRCFPFPPPGYERKPIIDDPDLLKKEKRREKKHKKDKDKKDGKEKREKDRSDGKHKEKKDKKDKHRDKKRDKEKSKTSTPDDKGQFEGRNGEIPHQNNPSLQFLHQNGDLFKTRRPVGDTENFKFVQELDRRIRDEEKGTGSHQFVVDGRKNRVNKVGPQMRDGRQVVTDVAGFGGNVAAGRSNGATPPMDNRNEKMKEKGNGGRQVMMDVAGFGGNLAVPNRINGATPPPLDNRRLENDKRKDKDRGIQKQGRDKEMEKLKEKSEQKKTMKGINDNVMMSDLVDAANNLPTYHLESSFQGIGNEGNLKKRKAMETNGVSRENEPRPNKIARPISNISPENGRKLDFLQNPGPSLLDKQGGSQGTPLNSFNNAGSKGGQRVNGMMFSQSTSISAKKPPSPGFNRPISKPSPIKSPPVITNHAATQLPPTTTKPQPSIPKPPPSIPNPIITHHHLPPLSSPPPPPPLPPPPPQPLQPPVTSIKQPIPRPKPPPAVVNKAAPAPAPAPAPIPKKKPPHPDTKYLHQILSVPKLEPWCGVDDQEWLYSSKAGGAGASRKPPTTTTEPEVQVWSEAKHIESVDVCALPYVIPY